ncbi:MAG: glycosyltransferase, partial [Candidatus Delongbacteria bacterium]|nr:glycosyltransferase [Candidatus Delongbacteria bacterium]
MKLSVITINRNDVLGLQNTTDSVLSQTSFDFEYIIIDGASTDGSKELIERLAINDKRLTYWCSELDSGIYHAMNKGITQAKGEYLLFLNSGDYFCDE